jgi:hypothetical protein
MEFRESGRNERLRKHTSNYKWILALFIAVAFISLSNMSFAATAVDWQKYQIVNGSDDKAYLVNTATGFVWVLTYRTTATGREPIAIPYKFIKVCPKNEKDFIVEDVQGACLPGN